MDAPAQETHDRFEDRRTVFRRPGDSPYGRMRPSMRSPTRESVSEVHLQFLRSWLVGDPLPPQVPLAAPLPVPLAVPLPPQAP